MNANVYIFTGPTIAAAEARAELEAVYLPPAAEGDVYRAALKRPKAIGIIDGYFQSVPTVRHKEILWAMSRGIHVFGSASIGALRAAELTAFGMEGIGTVFDFYRDGILEDDDEVAVLHGPAETEFRAGSEAMVNVRQTLRRAEEAGVISRERRDELEAMAKAMFYPERTYAALFRCAAERGLRESEMSILREWLPQNRVNQKRDDAITMLQLIRKRLIAGLPPKTVSYCFEHTSMWESASRQAGELRLDANGAPGVVSLDSLVEELRLAGDLYQRHWLGALERFLALREADRLGLQVSDELRAEAERAFCRERGLIDAASFEQWKQDNGWDDVDLSAFLMEEARLRWIHQRAQFFAVSGLAEQLRVAGEYSALAERALAKERLFGSLGGQGFSLANAQMSEAELVRWYFEQRLARSAPENVEEHASKLGFATPQAFRRALLKEYLFCCAQDRQSTAGLIRRSRAD